MHTTIIPFSFTWSPSNFNQTSKQFLTKVYLCLTLTTNVFLREHFPRCICLYQIFFYVWRFMYYDEFLLIPQSVCHFLDKECLVVGWPYYLSTSPILSSSPSSSSLKLFIPSIPFSIDPPACSVGCCVPRRPRCLCYKEYRRRGQDLFFHTALVNQGKKKKVRDTAHHWTNWFL